MYTLIKMTHLYNKKCSNRLLLSLLVGVGCVHNSGPCDSMEQHVCRQHGNVTSHGAHAQEVKQEEPCVLSTDAVIHPNTVVVESLHAAIA